jgi:tetratricopeptide (TPR) repeat protein
LVPEAYLKLGLIYYNRDNYDESLNWYQKVVQSYSGTPASNEAMLAIKDIYIAKGDPAGYIAFANKYPGAKVTASEQDSLIYLAAEGQFMKGNIDKALAWIYGLYHAVSKRIFCLAGKFLQSGMPVYQTGFYKCTERV